MSTAKQPAQQSTIIAGNWKMNLTLAESAAFAAALKNHYLGASCQTEAPPSPAVLLFPASPFLAPLASALRDTPVLVGAQDLHQDDSGAHTGDVSARQLRSAGATWVLCGHSERRQEHTESSTLVAAKTQAALDSGLTPLVCVGETLAERDAGDTEKVLASQLAAVLEHCPALSQAGEQPRWALAYEPVWAIGTGKTATPEIAQRAHGFLRDRLAQRLGDTAQSLPLLYGGSAKPENCQSLLTQPDVDGLLIGGASLDSAVFLDIICRCG